MHRCFAACRPGLERCVAEELAALGVESIAPEAGGVSFSSDLVGVARANLWLGSASAVRVRVGEFEARHFSELVKKVARLPWSMWLRPDVSLEFRVTSRRSRLYHTEGIAQRLAEGIAHELGVESKGDGPPVPIVARLVRDHCTLSIDTSGEGLHRRGWRLQTAKAPLREDLAHALLRSSGWTPSEPLCDPMMGSGTLVIEAAGLALGLAPGRSRSFAFERLAMADGLRSRLDPVRHPPAATPLASIVGRDRERGALEAARGNAARAGVLEHLDLGQADLDERPLPAVACVITNPPYGQRVAGDETLMQRLGERVRECGASRVAMVVPQRRWAVATGLSLQPRALVDHGGQKVEFMIQAPAARASPGLG